MIMSTIEVRLLLTEGAGQHVRELLERLTAVDGVINVVELYQPQARYLMTRGDVALPTAGDWEGSAL